MYIYVLGTLVRMSACTIDSVTRCGLKAGFCMTIIMLAIWKGRFLNCVVNVLRYPCYNNAALRMLSWEEKEEVMGLGMWMERRQQKV